MGRYRLSRAAREDLIEIVAYMAADNSRAASELNDRIEQTIKILSDNPKAGRERAEVAKDVRSFPIGPYVLLYRQAEDEILIARILHSARDIDELLAELNQ